MIANPTIRHHLEPGDAAAIASVQRSIFCEAYEFDHKIVPDVEAGVASAIARGWPEAGGVWLVELDGSVGGSLALTFEGQAADGVYTGRVRWFALEPELRGGGLGRRMFEELLETAEDQGMERLELFTFSELAVAERLYRSYGFTLAAERERSDLRRDGGAVVYQQYVANL